MVSNTQVLPGISTSEQTVTAGSDNIYEDQTIGAELTKKDINRVAWRSMLLQASFNYERMQASGWLYGLLPALKKIHTNKNDLARAMKGHMGFFNTHPFLVTFVIGIILAMERSKQDVNSIQSTKIAVGAPLGGIGDAMFWLTLLPICGGIGASLALQGSILGAVVFLVMFNVVHLGLRFGLASLCLSHGRGRHSSYQGQHAKSGPRRLYCGYDGDWCAGGDLCSISHHAGNQRWRRRG
ncbi:mannose/fructose/N-acetylgalactosamine-specific phosphotransferase system component IID [Ewingella americana]